jgi:hypothetical protein
MKHTKIIFYVCLVAVLFFNFALAELIERIPSDVKENEVEKPRDLSVTNSPSEISPAVENEKVLPQPTPALQKPINYILVADVLDGFGGVKYGGGCDLSYFAGGQSSPIGPGSSTNYRLYAGFIYPTVVLCGDVNKSGIVELGDLVYLISFIYRGGPAPDPFQAGDVTCDGNVQLGDVVYLITYLYKGGPPPVC